MQSTTRLNTSYLNYSCPCIIHIYALINKYGNCNGLSIYLYIYISYLYTYVLSIYICMTLARNELKNDYYM